ncbi:MAG: hypothetical protein AAGA75_17575 [Cyanobacteria bacterium P01_E01_bin.6]
MNKTEFNATQYDRFRRMYIPCFDELYRAAIRVIEGHITKGDRTNPLFA